MRFVLLIGSMAAGKTTVARWLVRHKGYELYSLSEPIREVLHIAAPWLAERSKGEQRRYFQLAGRFLREFDPNPLLRRAEEALLRPGGPVVIYDGRTLEEAEWARRRGFVVVVVTALRMEREERLLRRDGLLPAESAFGDATESDWRRVGAPVVDTTSMDVERMCEAVWEIVERGER